MVEHWKEASTSRLHGRLCRELDSYINYKLIDCVSLSSIQEEEEEEKGTIWLLLYFNFLTLSQNCLEDKMLSC
jgi:hypothetical protein